PALGRRKPRPTEADPGQRLRGRQERRRRSRLLSLACLAPLAAAFGAGDEAPDPAHDRDDHEGDAEPDRAEHNQEDDEGDDRQWYEEDFHSSGRYPKVVTQR